jgi:hypothetical protein
MIKPGAAVHPRRTLILVACMMATEATVVATATIVAEMHSAELYLWVFSAYTPSFDGGGLRGRSE